MKNTKVFIFDMDGLMFETGRLAYRGYLASAEKHDFEFNHAIFYYLAGRTEQEIIKRTQELFGSELDTLAWRRTMNQARNGMIAKEQRVGTKKGLIELLDYAKQVNIQCVVATSNSLANAKSYLNMEGVAGYFDAIISREDVATGKPAPDLFLAACEIAGVAPDEAIVFEDSFAGIEAAHRAGIFSVLVEDKIDDMPEVTGRHELLVPIEVNQTVSTHYDKKFASLAEAKTYFVTCT